VQHGVIAPTPKIDAMQSLLAIECSSHIGAVAYLPDVKRPDDWTGEVMRDTVKLSAWVLPAVERVLTRANASQANVSVVAFGAGPGAFTGVRTACATAQALAYAWQVPLIAVDSLEALAAASSFANVDIVLDARMNELYSASFARLADGTVRRVSDTVLSSTNTFVPRDSAMLLGSGAALVTAGNSRVTAARAEETEAAEARWAYGVARVAMAKLATHEYTDPQHAEPIYVRNKVALTEVERAAKHASEPASVPSQRVTA
jgi:tRNA threonylcarbamoyladenosine biosynthesis protein TsaB